MAPLAEVGPSDLAMVGGKAANLGELIRAGFPVPAGFVVTTNGYRAVRDEVVSAAAAPSAAASVIRGLLEQATLPQALAAEILDAYRALGGGPVAVRSSATAEDLPGAAFAGQQDTYLNVIGDDEVLDAVRRCWASLFTDRAVAYRGRLGFDPDRVEIAVVVQRQIAAEYAGVLFTANPITGSRAETVIDASPGLGESVVSGLVTPDHLVIGPRGRVLERSAGRRETVLVVDPAGGTTHGAAAASAVLSEAAVSELAALGLRIARHFGRPQDIEWAVAGTEVWIVQARPLTALPPEPLRVNPLRRRAAAVLAELAPLRPYPLDMSWVRNGHGHVFVRMLAEIPGLRVSFDQILPERDGVVQELRPPDPRPTRAILGAPLRLRRRVAAFKIENWSTDARMIAFDESIRNLRAVDPTAAEWEALLQVPYRCFAALDRFIDLRIDYLPGAGAGLLRLGLLLAVLGMPAVFGEVAAGARTRTRDANDALAALAHRIIENPVWKAAFADGTPDDLERATAGGQPLAALQPDLRRFLDEFGHRETTSALLVSEPTWSDHPRILLGVLTGLVAIHAAAQVVRADPLPAILSRRRVRWTRSGRRLTAAAAAARAGIAFREDSHFQLTRPLPIVRSALLEVGRRLATAGVLADPHDVFHLQLDELTALPEPSAVSEFQIAEVRRLVAARAAGRAELAGAPLISPLTLNPRPTKDAKALVAGTPASGGTATGRVRLIAGPDDFGRLRAGEILVCPYTNPSWTPLFQIAAAVVVETGGLASHAAIVAREYGVPAIVGAAGATRLLADGRQVMVDGNAGRVRPVGAEPR